jgi:chromosomal replication initiation ATPase DnaA
MRSRVTKEKENQSSLYTLPVLIKTWRDAIVPVITALAAVFAAIGLRSRWSQIIAYVVILVLAGLTISVIYRVRRRRRIEQQRIDAREAFEDRQRQRTAFRGLYPYREGDQLPGHQRKRQAQTIFTQITDPNFTFGVICGASGTGKTSLLRCALQSLLKQNSAQTGLRVLYVSNPLDFAREVSPPKDPADRLHGQLEAIKRAVASGGTNRPVVVIIDQFDEFFVQYRNRSRRALGDFLQDLTHGTPPARVLCAVRLDFLIEMRLLRRK